MSDTDDRTKPWAIIIAAIITAIVGPIVVWWYTTYQPASQSAAQLTPQQGTPPRQVARPTDTDTVQPTSTPMVSIPRSHWPASPQEAANYFAKSNGSWEINKYGGWHLIPQWPPIEVTVPLGVTMEGYNDGPNPPQTRRCMTVLGPAQVGIQGGRFGSLITQIIRLQLPVKSIRSRPLGRLHKVDQRNVRLLASSPKLF